MHNFDDGAFTSTFVGRISGNFTNTGDNNSGFGTNSFSTALTSGDGNSAFSAATLSNLTTGSNNTACGYASLNDLTTSSGNSALGNGSGQFLVSGANNVMIGLQSANAYLTTESSNIVISSDGTAGDNNIIRIGTYGAGAGQQNKCYIASCYSNPGVHNTFVGELAGNITLNTGVSVQNTAVGQSCLNSLTTGLNNTCFGNACGEAVDTGVNNVIGGSLAFGSATSSNHNSAWGDRTLQNILTGSDNSCLGMLTGSNYTGAESSNILIGSTVQGTVGESNVLRIGNGTGAAATNLNKAFISGIRGITTGNADAIAVLIDSAGQLGNRFHLLVDIKKT